MTDQKKIVIIGDHGKVMLLAPPKPEQVGHAVDSIIRTHVIRTGAASRQTVDFYDDGTPIAEAVA
ncbi:MAG: hypothetical protein GXY30_02970 [Xanthomonadaceae bacterium]|nr:hypothetical protein [Xanthomonadaceae bacterium]